MTCYIAYAILFSVLSVNLFKHKKRIFVGLITTFFLGVAVLAHAKSTEQANAPARIVTVNADGQSNTLVVKAKTIADAVEQSGVRLGKVDKTEPSLGHDVKADNTVINVYRAHPITVVDGSNRYTIMTAERSPREIAKDAGFETKSEDRFVFVRPHETYDALPSTQLVIQRAKTINFDLYGKQTLVTTHHTSVLQLLKDQKIILQQNDELNIPEETRLVDGMTISIANVVRSTEVVDEVAKMPIEEIKDPNQNVGFKQVKEAGKDGKKKVTYETLTRNGGTPERKAVSEEIIEQPVKQVVIVGAKSTTSFDGTFAEALARLRSCEGSYTSNTGNGYYGAYQFDIGTWGGYGGYANASLAPPAVQDEKAWSTYQRRGWQPWPSCKIKMGLQDIYR